MNRMFCYLPIIIIMGVRFGEDSNIGSVEVDDRKLFSVEILHVSEKLECFLYFNFVRIVLFRDGTKGCNNVVLLGVC